VFHRVPTDRIQQYEQCRIEEGIRDHKTIHKRFPELENARDAFFGKS
jgi:hypothetical protein